MFVTATQSAVNDIILDQSQDRILHMSINSPPILTIYGTQDGDKPAVCHHGSSRKTTAAAIWTFNVENKYLGANFCTYIDKFCINFITEAPNDSLFLVSRVSNT